MASGPEGIKFDLGRRRVYVACSSGVIFDLQMLDPDQYRKLEDSPVQKNVYSPAVDPETHHVSGKASARLTVCEALLR